MADVTDPRLRGQEGYSERASPGLYEGDQAMEPLGPILMALSLPLILRWVPQNRFYGLRVPATLKNKAVWYDANALAGRHMFLFGVALIVLDYTLSIGGWPEPSHRRIFYWAAIGGLLAITAVDWRTANRWARERQ